MQRLGLIAVIGVAAYLLVMTLFGPERETAENPLASPAPPPAMQNDMTGKADKKPMSKMSVEGETRKLLAELRIIPVSEYAVNLEKYERLLELHPGDETFLRKIAFYRERLSQQRQAQGY